MARVVVKDLALAWGLMRQSVDENSVINQRRQFVRWKWQHWFCGVTSIDPQRMQCQFAALTSQARRKRCLDQAMSIYKSSLLVYLQKLKLNPHGFPNSSLVCFALLGMWLHHGSKPIAPTFGRFGLYRDLISCRQSETPIRWYVFKIFIRHLLYHSHRRRCNVGSRIHPPSFPIRVLYSSLETRHHGRSVGLHSCLPLLSLEMGQAGSCPYVHSGAQPSWATWRSMGLFSWAHSRTPDGSVH